MNKNKILLIILLVVVFAGGTYWYLKRTDSADEPEIKNLAPEAKEIPEVVVEGDLISSPQETEETSPSVFVIAYTDKGFSPSPLSIMRGDKVVFKNDSSRSFWPASAKHPTHEVYPEKSQVDCLGSSFDACRPISPGGEWEFTFIWEGEWGYHDHLTPAYFGKIIVK